MIVSTLSDILVQAEQRKLLECNLLAATGRRTHLLLFGLLLVVFGSIHAAEIDCVYGGMPKQRKAYSHQLQILKNDAYWVGYDNEYKNPDGSPRFDLLNFRLRRREDCARIKLGSKVHVSRLSLIPNATKTTYPHHADQRAYSARLMANVS